MTTSKLRIAMAVALLGLPSAAILRAQTAAKIVGLVKDQEGKIIAEASIVATGQKSTIKRKIKSEPDGGFVLAEIPPDTYEISATCDICNDVSSVVEVGAGQTRSIELTLDTKSNSTEISIDKHAATLDATSARLGSNATAGEIEAIPVNGRTYGPLALAIPLVSNSAGADFQALRFGGMSNQQNRYRLDGVDASSVVSAAPGFVPVSGVQFRLRTSVDSVQEFRVDAAMYPAEDGFGAGGQFKLVSKSGGADWHGGLSEYLRNDKLNARNFFDGVTKTGLHMNQFGGNAGGALKKDKLFVFASLEGLRQSAGLNILESAPSPHARQNADLLILPLLNLLGATSLPTQDPDVNAASRAATATESENNANIRVDYVANLRNRGFLRYSRTAGNQVVPDNTTTARSISSNTRPDNAVFSWNTELNAKMINQVTIGLNRAPVNVGVTGGGADAYGIRVIVGGAADNFASPGGLVQMVNGDWGRGALYHGSSWNFSDHLDLLLSSHSVKVGGEARMVRMPLQTMGGTVYRFLNPDTLLSNSDADVTYTGDVPLRVALQTQWAGYVQDEWRLRPNLVLNLGLRYEYASATREQNNKASIFDPYAFTVRQAAGGFYEASKLGFAPRLALAWSPERARGNTVVRTGVGIYQGPLTILDTIQPIQNSAIRSFIRGSIFPQPPSVLTGDEAQRAPYAFDASSFAHPQRNIVFSTSVQQSLPGQFVGQIGYGGILSRHLVQQATSNLGRSVDPDTGDIVRPNDSFGAIQYLTSGGTSSYHAFQSGLTRRFVDMLTISASYTWAHSIGDSLGTGEAQAAQNPNCLACEKASNNFDTKHTVNLSAVYSLPFGARQKYFSKGLVGALAADWALAGSFNAHSGLPLNVVIDRPDEIYRDGSTYYSPYGFVPDSASATVNVPYGGEDRGSQRPNLVPGVNPYQTGGGPWLNPTAFSIPLPGTMGNLGRNAFRGPGFSQIDLQLSRSIRISERVRIELRGEGFNVANHTNFAPPTTELQDQLLDASPGSGYSSRIATGFGQLNSTVGRTVGLGTSRQVQVGVRVVF